MADPTAPTVTMRDANGVSYDVPADQVAGAQSQGLTTEGSDARTDRLTDEVNTETYGGAQGKFLAGAAGLARGASFGTSDAAIAALGGSDTLRHLRDANPYISTGSNIIGALLPAIATGGASAEASGVEIAGELGAGALESGAAEAGGGLLARAAVSTAKGAAEGAAQGAGGYISDVALGDRKLSADGFLGAMGQGALWGGAAGGALSLSGEGLTAARRLIPAAELTAVGAKAARKAATDAITDAVSDSTTLAQTADSKLTELGAEAEINNPGYKQRIQEIRLKAAQEQADAQTAIAKSKQRVQELSESTKAAKAADGAAVKKTKPALDFLDKFATPADEGAEKISTASLDAGNEAASKVGDAAADTGMDALMSQLQGTKAGVDSGQSLTDIAAKSKAAINEELAKVNPEAAKINDALKRTKASSEKLNGWLDKYGGDSSVAFDTASPTAKRAKIADWAKSADPADVEGQKAADHFQNNPERTGMRMGANGQLLGPDAFAPELRKAANEAGADAAHRAYLDAVPEAANVSKSGTELMARSRYASERAAAKAQDEVHTAWAAGRPIEGAVAAAEPAEAVGAKVEAALKNHGPDFADDVNETAQTLNEHEAAHADLADALGQSAPPSSVDKASEFRAAQKTAEDKTAAQTQLTSDGIAKAPPSAGRQLLEHATNAAQTYEALRMMGAPLPDPKGIPVVGPLLSVYLKAKLVGKALGGKGGGVLATAETTIASKAAATRQRIYSAADAMLAGTSKVLTKAAPLSGGVADILGHKLFDSGKPTTEPYSSAPETGSVGDLYLKRSAEVTAAMKPGAIADALTKRINTSDPDALNEIIATKTREIQYIASKMPQPSSPPGILEDRVWLPAKADLSAWTRVVGAAQNPAGVLERAAAGQASADELEAVKSVYPSLYADAQRHVIEQVSAGKGQGLTTSQRNSVASTWGLPLTTASQPGHAQWLQAEYTAAPPAPQPTAPAMQPTISAPVNLGQRTLTHLDQP